VSGTDFTGGCTILNEIIDTIYYYVIGPLLNLDLSNYGCAT